MGTWIDFKKLREQLDFAVVLTHYGVDLKANPSGQHHGRCPLPMHPKENISKAFSANLKKKIWRCFVCGDEIAGNILDFAVCMEGRDPKNTADVRVVALKLQETFLRSEQKRTPAHASQPQPKAPPSFASSVLVNPPLDFTLKNLDAEHTYFRKRGLLGATLAHFGLGYCTKGMCSGRIAIPLQNERGELIGYAGRLTDEFEVTDNEPAYVWPANRERNGRKHIFDRGKFLYHGHAIKGLVTDLVVVQYPEGAWNVWQTGALDVVALMWDTPSIDQSKAIIGLVKPKGRIWLLTDSSKAGERCAAELFFDLGPHRFCRWVKLPQGQPADYSTEQLREMFAWNTAGM